MYIKSTDDGIWTDPGHTQFAYSDGDEVENRIAGILKETQDLSTLSAELRQRITDWPTQYHFSSQRGNLLRPLKSVLSGSVLEIGSGCGAITRLLGETAQSVVALEGSRRRAQITRERTRDLPHVDVYCDEFSRFSTPQTFDAVTLIGVLEYAALFVTGQEPHLQMLKRARELLNDSGCLVIAIENQLGLKYFAGASEDHLGRPMMGLENNYVNGGVRTFGQLALQTLLKNAGFEYNAFYYPFPDYKLPSSVLSERAFDDPAFNPAPFLVSTAGKDPQLPQEPNFALERVWPMMANNGLAQAVSNSFLIVARKRRAEHVAPSQVLAWHYSTSRQPAFCKETVFERVADQATVAISRHVLKAAPASDTVAAFEHLPAPEPSYTKAPLLSEQFVEIISRPDWTFEQLKGFLFLYAKLIEQSSGVQLRDGLALMWDAELPGALFDCLPQNIALTGENTALVFDQEWRSRSPIHFKHLVFRAMLNGVSELSSIGASAASPDLSMFDLIERSMNKAGANVTQAELTVLLRSELDFQHFASGVPTDFIKTLKHLQFGRLRQSKSHNALLSLKEKIGNLQWQLDNGVSVIADTPPGAPYSDESSKLLETQRRSAQAALTANSAYFSEAMKHLNQENLWLARNALQAAQEAAARRVTRRSPSNFLDQLSGARAFSKAVRSLDGGSYHRPPLQPVSAAARYMRNTPVVAAFLWIDDIAQAQRNLSRLGQLEVPLSPHCLCRSDAMAQAVSALAARLGFSARTSVVKAPNASVEVIRHAPEAQGGNHILLFRHLGADSDIDRENRPLQHIASAYSAMRTDPRIGAIYVNSPDSRQTSGLSLALFQPAFFQACPESSWHLMAGISPLQLKEEAEQIRSAGARMGMHTLARAC